MATSCHQIDTGSQIEVEGGESSPNQHVVQRIGNRVEEGTCQRPTGLAEGINMQLQHNRLTDVMFVDLITSVPTDSKVTVIDIGEDLGFHGQIQVRVDLERQIFYGLTIQNFSAFRRKILWQYRILSIQRAIILLVNTLYAGLDIDRRSPHCPAPSY